LYERYPERLRQPLALDAEGQDLRAYGLAFSGGSFLFSRCPVHRKPDRLRCLFGYTHGKDEKGDSISVVLVKVKKGKGRLTRKETLIKKAVEEGWVSWRMIFLKDKENGLLSG
jgi:hypothetical protein